MATYAIGDIQGCHRELLDLLDAIGFDAGRDRLWFTGDLVNRGPESLEVLRFVRGLDDRALVVLGNHDLHLLAAAAQPGRLRPKDTLDGVLAAPDRDGLLEWLRRRPLFHGDAELGFVMVHAGLPPQWSTGEAAERAAEVEAALRGEAAAGFYAAMYGDGPSRWAPDLAGPERLRFITNCLTRLRYLSPQGDLSLDAKGPPGTQPSPLIPWYAVPGRRSAGDEILFGHWSTVHLGTETDFGRWRVHPLDTGCVWGGRLTALRLEDRRLFSVPSRQPRRFEE
jgi:bis(5'-nucleosyl)-tetraphosphatase (symmetrical)